jgi:phosphonatase-like hydrolase
VGHATDQRRDDFFVVGTREVDARNEGGHGGQRRFACVITLACLDMAGTTVADGGAVESSFVDAMVRSGVAEESEQMRAALDFVRESMGQSKIVVFRHLFAGNEMRAARANDAFEAAYARAVDDGGVVAMPGATGVFAELREMGLKVCLTTGFAPPTRDRIIDALRWHTLVDLVLSPADAGRGRPAPDMILTAVLRLEIEAVDDVAVAGDTVSDLISGTRAGAGVVAGVLTGAHSRSQLEAAPHTHIVDSIADLPVVLRG